MNINNYRDHNLMMRKMMRMRKMRKRKMRKRNMMGKIDDKSNVYQHE